jgi:hypothetical protein
MATAAAIVAPTVFGVLQSWDPTTGRVLAGQVFGAVLGRVYLLAYIAAGVMLAVLTLQRVLGPRPKSYGIRVGLIAVMLGLTLYTSRLLAPRIDGLQAQVKGPLSQLPGDDARRIEFDRLHSWSTTLLSATMVGGLVLLAWETRE